jgi:tetratricopeptide (TPR) repeat protein
MAGTTLSIKLRCGSWQQLATIYRRDLSRGAMFLKAATQPPLGTIVKIDLELPSATVLELTGTITQHVVDPQRGTGVELKLEPLATKTVWLIESALAAENSVRGAAPPAAAADTPAESASAISDGENIAEAEAELIRALEAEAESLRKLNPFLVLGVGYETTDGDVRAAFGELTKRYHPDRFARYQSTKLRQIAAEIFILIRDAYRKLADETNRAQVRQSLAIKPGARAQTQPGKQQPPRIPTQQIAKIAVPPPLPKPGDRPELQPKTPGPHDAPTNPSGQSAMIASTQLARPEDLQPPPSLQPDVRRTGPVRIPATTEPIPPSEKFPIETRPRTGPVPLVQAGEDTSEIEQLIDDGKLDDALAAYRALAKKSPQDRSARAGIELVEGLKAMAMRDRLEAAQRFEATLEIDPSNERAARELADMRRQATNERKGLLSRLMGKKEGPP